MFPSRSTWKAAVLWAWLGLFGPVGLVDSANSLQAAQGAAADSPPPRIVGPYLSREDVGPFTKVVFKNGLTVLLFERSNAPLVAMVTYVKAGRLHQDPSSQEFWNLWTPLLFHSRLPGEEATVAGEARRIGAVLDGGVGKDHAWFSTVLPREEYRRGLDLQVAALRKWNPSSCEITGTQPNGRTAVRNETGPSGEGIQPPTVRFGFPKGKGIRWEDRFARQPSLGRCLSNRELSGSLVGSRERFPGDHRRF